METIHCLSNLTVTLWAAVNQVQKSAIETGVSFKDYGEPNTAYRNWSRVHCWTDVDSQAVTVARQTVDWSKLRVETRFAQSAYQIRF